MSREGQSLSAMTDVMSNLTGKIVVVQDKRLEVQAVSVPRNNKIDVSLLIEILPRREHLPKLLRNRKAAAKARQSYWQQLLPVENMGRLISPIVSGDRARGYLSVVGPADELDFLDSLAVEHGAAACALEMAKAKAVSEARKALRGDFLEGLLSRTLPKKEIERLAGRLDHDTSVPHAILTFSWVGSDTPSVRRLETAVHWTLANHNRAALVHIHSDQHVCVFQALKNDQDLEAAHDLGRRIYEQTAEEFPDARLIGGSSGPAASLYEWPEVYEQALQAMQLGQRLNLNHVVQFSSLGVYGLLVQLENIPVVRQFTQQIIGPLAEYDEQHRSNMVQTMDAYFDHHGNISQTAESLFIHRNTLLYRLERIKELTGQDLNQANMRLALHLALKLWLLQPESSRE
jgi:purine catabolism regulator